MTGTLFLLGLMTGGLAPTTQTIEVPLTYVRYPDVEDSESPYSSRGELEMEILLELPDGKWKLPKLLSEQPLYALTPMGDTDHLFVLDRVKAGDPFFSRIYFDANGNGDLTDDAPIPLSDELVITGFIQSLPLDITLTVDGEEVPYGLKVAAFSEEMMEGEEELDTDELVFRLTGNCAYSTRFELGKHTYSVLLSDDDVNGKFGDQLAYDAAGPIADDRAFVTSGDLIFLTSGDRIAEFDQSPLGSKISLGGQIYSLEVDTKKSQLRLRPIVTDLGTVDLPIAPERLFLATADGGEYLIFHQPGKKVQVPPGEYRVAGYQLYRKDPQGDLWFLSAAATPESPFITVGKGASTKALFGEPFMPRATVPEATEAFARGKPERLEVEFAIAGSGHEIVTDLRHVSGNKTAMTLDRTGEFPTEPVFRIASTKGKVVAQGAFEYG